ncbi:tRNA lysidine(34) synthetase TilS [Acetobacter oeni]|uniref:tRNA(Ile)-lysidine synthase n=1 Tax=Acetobacter oeni TaxID=304077 RepID=A0A511XL92_9PROT|nr:tRNA lysidine(34) synthetase TilS [Acetobacter oeni]MBB3883912.1 tRNA(Ile)-lysidine synthase [Acetobacter oeni]NHO19919.1 tRNA lysidine(34) synthetase TilS [Acetobacter oeni]GEN63706.1 tRNA(Ile)-lysidine synthase [Acetobacter oeni]
MMARLGPWSPDTQEGGPVALAVSGGGDSLALAWLAAAWRHNLVAFVVDHGLRAESASEALTALKTLQEMNIEAHLLTLSTLQPGPGLADRARKARYAVLTKACRKFGSLNLLLGHQADDQAETIAMRELRGKGDGLAGMAWATETPDIRLVRPLLGMSRFSLRNTLRHAGISWSDDPSNENECAERVRIRKRLSASERSRLLDEAVKSGERRQGHETSTAAGLAAGTIFSHSGWVRLGNELPSPDILAALIRSVGGNAYPPSRRVVAAFRSRNSAGTLFGTRLLRVFPAAGLPEEWVLMREYMAMAPAMPAADEAIWDGRFALRYDGDLEGISIAATGSGLKRDRREGIPAVLCATLPALWRGGRRICVPHLGLCEEPALKRAGFRFTPAVAATTCALWSSADRAQAAAE